MTTLQQNIFIQDVMNAKGYTMRPSGDIMAYWDAEFIDKNNRVVAWMHFPTTSDYPLHQEIIVKTKNHEYIADEMYEELYGAGTGFVMDDSLIKKISEFKEK